MPVEKVSLSLPAELLAEARDRAGGNLSAYVAASLRRQLLAERQSELLDDLEREYGPIRREDLEEARRVWLDLA